jgi:GNAT superfamily N-acetyltransferase
VPFEVHTVEQRPDLEEPSHRLGASVWPEVMLHDEVVNRFWGRLYDDFAGFQVVISDEKDRVLAFGNTVPVFWDGTVEGLPEGLDAVLEEGVRGREEGRVTNTLSALAAVVSRDHQGRGLSVAVLEAMKTVAAERGLGALIAPVRPTFKERYPLTPFARYVEWEREDGLPFDPWLRVHRRLGARPLRVAPRSMTVRGTVADWEVWTGMRFPESGPYVVPGALQAVAMDLEKDLGLYEEPNLWMRHPIPTS